MDSMQPLVVSLRLSELRGCRKRERGREEGAGRRESKKRHLRGGERVGEIG